MHNRPLGLGVVVFTIYKHAKNEGERAKQKYPD